MIKISLVVSTSRSAASLIRHFVKIILSLVLVSFTTYAFAQETNCTDGIDNDGDRLIDYYDDDCACEEDKFFNKCETGCQYTGTLSSFNFATAFESDSDVMLYGTPLVGDVDGDGEPEIIAVSATNWTNNPLRWTQNILVFDGASGQLERTITTPYFSWGAGPNSYVIGDIDNDGFGEIIINILDNTVNTNPSIRGKLQAYNLEDGSLKWTSDAHVRSTQPAGEKFGGTLGLADFNQDGIAEVYIYNEIFNAQTGVKLADGGEGNQMGISQIAGQSGALGSSIAADLTAAPGLELAGGNTVYTVSITNPNGTAGNSMTPGTVAGKADGFTTVADIDLDGELDVIVSVRGANTGEVYVYNPRTTTVIANRTNLDGQAGKEGIGAPFVGDIDNDNAPEIGVTRSQRLIALEYNGTSTLQQKWSLSTTDDSGQTGITMFDFDQDGKAEIVYRDENDLRVIDGSTAVPVNLVTSACASGTGTETAIVADIDNDGAAEICTTCQSGSDNKVGKLKIFESNTTPWAPARKVWNQYNYHVTNINDDLTVPQYEQNHGIAFTGGRALNASMVQATLYSSTATPIFPGVSTSTSSVLSSCGPDSITVHYTISNADSSGFSLPKNFVTSFYNGVPGSGGVLLGVDTLEQGLAPGNTINQEFTFLQQPSSFQLYLVTNSASISGALDVSDYIIPQCTYDNNVEGPIRIEYCDGPVADLNGVNIPGRDYTTTFTEDGGAIPLIPPAGNLRDSTSAVITTVTIKILNLLDGADETLDVVTGSSGISKSYSSGTLTLSGSNDTATYNQVFKTLTYLNIDQSPTTTQRKVLVLFTDGLSSVSDSSFVFINIVPVNDAPTAADKTLTTNEDTPVTVTTADLGYTDLDGDALSRITVTIIPAAGTLFLDADTDGVIDAGEALAANAQVTKAQLDAGELKFLPAANGNGTPYANFGFRVNDGTTDAAAANTITFNVTAVNDAPTAADKTLTTNEDTPVTVTTADLGYSDLDGDALSRITVTIIPAAGTLFLDADTDGVIDAGEALAANAQVTKAQLDAGQLKLLPAANGSGSPYANFGFRVNDGTTDAIAANTITFNVNPVNDAPTAADKTLTISEDTPVTVTTADLGYSDVDGDQLNRIIITTIPGLGTLFLDANTDGIIDGGEALAVNAQITKAQLDANQLKFLPAANGNGSPYANFGFRVNDGTTDATAANTITFNVNPVNDAPTAADKTLTTNEDTPVTVSTADLGYSDIDGDQLNRITVTIIPAAGTLFIDADNDGVIDTGEALDPNDPVTKAQLDAGELKFLPAANGNGTPYANFGFRVNDGTVDAAAPNTITFNVTAVNDAPTAADKTLTTNEDTPVTVTTADLGYSDIDGDQLNRITITTVPGATGTLFIDADNDGEVDAGEALDPNDLVTKAQLDAGELKFLPAANGSGTPYSNFSFKVNDGTIDATAANTITFNVNPVNDAPTAADKTLTTNEDTPVTVTTADLGYSDIDGDQLNRITITTVPGVLGTLFIDADNDGVIDTGEGLNANDPVTKAQLDANQLKFLPAANGNGSPYANFGFRVNDGTVDAAAPNTITFNVTAVNDPTVLDLDSDNNSGATGADYQTSFTEGNTNIAITDADVSITDVDNMQLSSVTVILTNRPDGTAESLSVNGTLPAGITVSDSYDNTDGQIVLSGAASLAAYQTALQMIVYNNTSENPDNTDRMITVVANDGSVNSNLATTTLSVIPVNDAPTAADNTVITAKNITYVFALADFGYADAEGTSIDHLKISSYPGVGTLFVDADNDGIVDAGETVSIGQLVPAADITKLKFEPVTNQIGNPYTDFDFVVNDGSLDAVQANTITIRVTPSNQLPTAANKTLTAQEDIPVTVTTADLGYSDPDGDLLNKITVNQIPAQGSLFKDANNNGVAEAVEVLVNGNEVTKAELDGGQLKFVPAANANGAAYSNFQFTVNDGIVNAASSNTITFNVTPVNDAPTATGSSVSVQEDTNYTFAVAELGYADVENDPLNHIKITALPGNGVLFVDADNDGVVDAGEEVALNQNIITANISQLKYKPVANFNGTDNFKFLVNDGMADAAQEATMQITVTPVNDAARWQRPNLIRWIPTPPAMAPWPMQLPTRKAWDSLSRLLP